MPIHGCTSPIPCISCATDTAIVKELPRYHLQHTKPEVSLVLKSRAQETENRAVSTGVDHSSPTKDEYMLILFNVSSVRRPGVLHPSHQLHLTSVHFPTHGYDLMRFTMSAVVSTSVEGKRVIKVVCAERSAVISLLTLHGLQSIVLVMSTFSCSPTSSPL